VFDLIDQYYVLLMLICIYCHCLLSLFGYINRHAAFLY